MSIRKTTKDFFMSISDRDGLTSPGVEFVSASAV